MSFFILCMQYANRCVLVYMVYLGATHTAKAHGGHKMYVFSPILVEL